MGERVIGASASGSAPSATLQPVSSPGLSVSTTLLASNGPSIVRAGSLLTQSVSATGLTDVREPHRAGACDPYASVRRLHHELFLRDDRAACVVRREEESFVGRFLTDDGVIAGPPSALVITSQAPVSAAYAQIIDIDGMEAWVVEARDASGVVLDSVTLTAGDPGTGDGIASPVSFEHATADICSIRLRYRGAANTSVGLAFDNFRPRAPHFRFIDRRSSIVVFCLSLLPAPACD